MGNIDAKRDWSYAGDYVESMRLMPQQEIADDYVIATGELHTVRELIEIACRQLKIALLWQGTGIHEIGINVHTQKEIIKIDPRFYRPTEVDLILGDASKAKNMPGWEAKIKFDEFVKINDRLRHTTNAVNC